MVATIIVAVAAVAAIVVLLVIMKKTGERGGSDNSMVTFKPTEQFAEECGEKAQELIAGNYTAVRLFVSEGLPHLAEPYGNPPEDGLYTVDSDEYNTFEQIKSLINSVYTEEEAYRILNRSPSDPANNSTDIIAVYAPREIFVNADEVSQEEVSVPKVPDVVLPNESAAPFVKQTVLGINENFKPYIDYKKPWGSISIKVNPISEEECDITVYLGADRDVNLSSVEETDILTTKMIRENNAWRLTKMVY